MTHSEIYLNADAEQRQAMLSVLAERVRLHAAKKRISPEAALMELNAQAPRAVPLAGSPAAEDRHALVKRVRAHADAAGCDFFTALQAVMARDSIDAVARKQA